MTRPYLVGWCYAIKDLYKKLYKSKNKKLKFKFWKMQLKKKYFWYTTEELVESNKKCWNELRKINIESESTKGLFNYEGEYNKRDIVSSPYIFAKEVECKIEFAGKYPSKSLE